MTLATKLVAEAGSMAGLLSWQESNFLKHKGIGRIKSLQLITVMEIARRALRQQTGVEPVLDHADGVAAYMLPIVAGLEVEKFWVLCLNRKGRLLKRVEISSGTVSCTLVHPREVFREAIREAASAIICVHNHPSGDPCASSHDITITRSLRSASAAIGIDLLDHVIVGAREKDPLQIGHYSFRSAGLI